MSAQITGIYLSSDPTALSNNQSGTARINDKKILLVDSSKSPAASTTAAGTVSAGTTAGGTQIIASNSSRRFAQCQNNGSVDVYFGTETVTSSFPKVVPGGTFTWHSQEALKVLASSGTANIAYIDYTV